MSSKFSFKHFQVKEFQIRLLDWYQRQKRDLPWRNTDNPYFIWVSEVMLQQTQVKTVIPYYQKFIQSFPDFQTLARSDQQEVLKIWEGLGYYARARNLHKAAKILVEKNSISIPKEFNEFKNLPGVGNYIAAAVLSIAFHKSFAVLDGNVKRVLARIFSLEQPVNLAENNKFYQDISQYLLFEEKPGDYNQAVMELGAIICLPRNPKCGFCPVTEFCMVKKNRDQNLFPKIKKRKPLPIRQLSAGVVLKENKILLVQRKQTGLLAGLWEFPNCSRTDGESDVAACTRCLKEAVGLRVSRVRKIISVKHAYTHFKIVMEAFLCDFQSGEVELNNSLNFAWIEPDELSSYPLTKVTHKIIPELKQMLNQAS